MVNEAFAGLVVSCDEDYLDLYHEKLRYVVERNKELAKKKKGDWVWFKVDKKNPKVVTECGDMPRRWNSRLSPDGEILLDLNAVQRNYREYPEMKTAAEPLPNKPWSCEVDYLEDPEEKLSYKRGYRVGKMHEVTVKVVVDASEQSGENDVSFYIQEVHYESPTDIQLEMGYSPWIQLLLNTKRPVEDQYIAPVRTRDIGKMHPKNKDYGVIMRRKEGKHYVWSNDSGLLFISCAFPGQYDHIDVGDFVHFKRAVRKMHNDIVAKELEKATRFVSRTKEVERRRDFFEALVETRIRFPKANEIQPEDRFFEHYDEFLGTIRVTISSLQRMLEDKGVSAEQVYGKRVRVWAGPGNMMAFASRSEDARFWVVEEVFPAPLNFDDDEDEYYHDRRGRESEDSEEEQKKEEEVEDEDVEDIEN